MGDVIELGKRREPKPSPELLAANCTSALLESWEKAAKFNRLNDFFTSSCAFTQGSNINYLNDLNEVAAVEQQIGMTVGIAMPGILERPQLGWRAYFKLAGTVIETPDMPYEAYARCFGILLHQRLKHELLKHGYKL
jgi:hypothetical protein